MLKIWYFHWDEMMQYNPSDSGLIGPTRGICPDGWDISTSKECNTMIDYLGGYPDGWLIADGKLKNTSTL